MKQDCSIAHSLETLRAVREAVHGDVSPSVIEQLDRVIQELEAIRAEGSSSYTAQDILMIVGRVIELLPTVARAVEQLRRWR